MARKDKPDGEWIEKALKRKHLTDPSDATVHKALSLKSQLPSGTTRWTLELLFDSVRTPQPAGVRSVAAGERRLLYRVSADDRAFEIDLQVGRANAKKRFSVSGQILPPIADATVHVENESQAGTPIGAGGEFQLDGLTLCSQFSLRIEAEDDTELILSDLPGPVAE